MINMTRRRLLQVGTATTAAAAFGGALGSTQASGAEDITLRAGSRIVDVHGKPARVYGITQANGTAGLSAADKGRFRVTLVNELETDTLVHWHGLTPPSDQDGVPGLSQLPLRPGQSYDYDFVNDRTGTFWMHSHVGLQEQQLLAAPLIVRNAAEAKVDEQEVLLLLHDFSFRAPEEIFEELRQDAGMDMMQEGHGDMEPDAENAMAMDEGMAMDHGEGGAMLHFNDIDHDAYLANDRTLADPEVVRVDPGSQIRLRLINAAAATNFLIDLGVLDGQVIAVDGNPIEPLDIKQLDLGIAQRADIRLRLPSGQGAYPILARREDDRQQTGIVLATKAGHVTRLPEQTDHKARPLDLMLEGQMTATSPLAPHDAPRTQIVNMTGSHAGYTWGFDDKTFDPDDPIVVTQGERAEFVLRNNTAMPHPIHLHGHHFQMVAIDGQRYAGAVRDTVLVPPLRSVTLAFDADNPGHWAFHCHQLYHMAAGMMTSVRYEGYQRA